MLASKLLLATQRENPSEAETISHQLMIRAGLIRQVASGIYNWLPTGKLVLNKVEEIVRKNMDNSGALEMLMPIVQPGELWKESGRWEKYGKELLIFEDRHEREFCLGPTHEEIITYLCKSEIRSHKQLPKTFYQIQTHFRDEIRPRFGVMRSREFIMKDAYSFDISQKDMDLSYETMRNAYIDIFDSLGLDYRIVKADSGAIGGSDSEEFHVLAESGEDLLAFSDKSDYAINAELLVNSQDDQNPDILEGKPSPDGEGKLKLKRGIEVGHIFKLGTKYSESLKLKIQSNSSDIYPEMGCYGIGISRVIAAAIEQNHDDKGIIWSEAMSPYQIALIEVNPKKKSEVTSICQSIYKSLTEHNCNVLWDDREQRAGVKFSDMELIGIPNSIIVGERSTTENIVEIKKRTSEKPELVPVSEVIKRVLKN